MSTNESSGNRELADLLPFYATGQLPLTEMRRIEEALAGDDALRRELALIEEEQAATVQANEMLGMPSARAAGRFFAMLDAEPARTTPRAVAKGIFTWLGERLQSLAPRQMAYVGIAAVVLVVAQAGYIGALLQGPGRGIFKPAFESGTLEGSFAQVAFTPDARAADISRLLDGMHATIVDGPRAGYYKVRIGAKDMSKADRDIAIARIAAEKGLVRFVAPSQ